MSLQKLDPRSKLWLLLLTNIALFLHVSLRTEILMTMLILTPYFLSGKREKALRWAAIYFALVFLDVLTPPAAEGAVFHLISLMAVSIRMMLPCFIAGAYAFTTTSISEFVCALRKIHVSEKVIIPCMVVIRFFPTIHEDYRQIKDALALRGIAAGRLGTVRHPMLTLEHILIPLLMNSNSVADDLTVAALSKGIRMPGAHTSLAEIRMAAPDYIWMFVCSLPVILNQGGVI